MLNVVFNSSSYSPILAWIKEKDLESIIIQEIKKFGGSKKIFTFDHNFLVNAFPWEETNLRFDYWIL